MNIQITLNRESQIILAEGRSRRWGFWNILALGILLGLIALFIAMWFALSRPIPIPTDTALIGVISPKAAKQLIDEKRSNLVPELCRMTLISNSDWPIVCGLTTSGQSFVIVPRWFPLPQAARFNAGFVTRIGDVVGSDKTMSYAEALGWRGLAKQPTLVLESAALEKWLGLENPSSTTKLLFRFDGRHLQSDIRLPASSEPLPAADIAFALGQQEWQSLPGELFLDAADLPDHKQWNDLPAVSRYAAWYDDQGGIQGKFLGFDSNLDQNQAARILGMMGVTERRQITLPDGSVSYERLLPTPSTSTDMFGRRQNDRGEWIELDQRFMLLSNASTTLDQGNVGPCGSGNPWLRLSTISLASALRQLGLQTEAPIIQTGIQAYSDGGKLTICSE
jgi:hypothetical protein